MVSKHSEDFQIALRQWLVKKLDNEEFYGLRWLDYTERIYFRIPWNKMEKDPHWVKEFELFRAWARNRGEYNENQPPKWPSLKSNFLNVIQKSNHFDEVPGRNVLDKQTGNYRVFKKLSQEEYQAKKHRRAQKKGKGRSKSSPSHPVDASAPVPPQRISSLSVSCDDAVQQPHYSVDPSVVLGHTYRLPSSPPGVAQALEAQRLPQLSESYPLEISATSSQELSVSQSGQHLTGISDSSSEYFTPETMEFEDLENLLQSPSNIQQSAEGGMASDSTMVPPFSSSGVSMSGTLVNSQQEVFLPQSQIPASTPFLEQIFGNFTDIDIVSFHVKVSYRHDVVLNTQCTFSQCYRLLYGSSFGQMHTAVMSGMQPLPLGLDQTPLELPDYAGDDPKVEQILKTTDQGILLYMDGEKNLWGMRLCQSRVFFFSQDQESNDEPQKMHRKQEQLLFSYKTYIAQLFEYKRGLRTALPEPEITLYIGVKPQRLGAHGIVGISLIPKQADKVKRCVVGDVSSLFLSESDSVDCLIRQTRLITM